MTLIEQVTKWFEDIAKECDKLTDGNYSRLREKIWDMAMRSAQYLVKQNQEPVKHKSDPLFDECVANVPDWVMKETSDKIDAMIVKEDLENEIAKYEEYLYGFESSSRDDCIGIARHFADFGARMMKEQMMKGAVEGVVQDDGNFIKFSDDTYIDLNPCMGAKPMFGLIDGTKVKLLVFKDDETEL